jgi:hypothetical protein
LNKFNFILDEAIEQTLPTERFIITFLDGSQMIKDVAVNNEIIVLLSEDEPEPTDRHPRGEGLITKIANSKNHFIFDLYPLNKLDQCQLVFNTKTNQIYQTDKQIGLTWISIKANTQPKTTTNQTNS